MILLACAQPPEEDVAIADAPFPEVEAPTSAPTWDAAGIEAAWAEAVSRGFPEVERPRDTWHALLAYGDETCPGDPDFLVDEVLTGCTAESGYVYAGVGGYVEVTEESHGFVGWQVHADATVTDAEGATFWVGGNVYHLEDTDEEGAFVEERIEGTWRWEGDDAWLADWTSGLLTFTLRDTLAMEGALTFSGLSFAADGFSFDAEGLASGTLSVRDPGGAWHTVTYANGACGDVTFDGDALGEACLDFQPLLDTWASR
ncbi:MAG: hypothetical protein ACOZNI_20340 [Myxococcota bacterium]